MENPDDIKREQLEKRYKKLEKDYTALYEQLNAAENAQNKNNLQLQIDSIYEEMKKNDNEIKQLKPNSFFSLVKILTANLDTDIAINSAIQTAYKSCCSRNSLQTKVESVKSIVEDLYNLDKRNLHSNEKFNHNDNTAKFIKSLITNSQIPQTKLEDL
ncbi:MAG: hypothetical protein ACKPGN_03685, partial [Dolichospermum sp.]